MCGRYVNYEDVDALAEALGISADDPVAVPGHGAIRMHGRRITSGDDNDVGEQVGVTHDARV